MILLPLGVSLLVLLLLVAVLWHRYPGKLPSALISISVTSVSVLLGLTSGLAIFNYTEEVKEQQELERLHSLLGPEVAGMKSHLEFDQRPTMNIDGQEVEFRVLGLHGEVLREAGLSGLFDVKESHQMLELAQSIDAWNRKTKGLLGAINANPESDMYVRRIEWYMTNLESSSEGLLDALNWLESELDLERWPTVRY